MNKKYNIMLAVGVVACSVAGIGAIADNIKVQGKDASIIYQGDADKVALEEGKTQVAVYKGEDKVFTSAVSDIDNITFTEKPVADMLDVVFKSDGTAEDVSPMHMTVQTTKSGALDTYYNMTYQRYVAKFNNTWAGSTSGFYKVDYSSNQEFKDKLADGHTLEAVVMAGYTEDFYNDLVANPNEKEAKFFASHEAGGTGLYLCKGSKGLNKKNEITFLPNVGGWKFATSGIVPEPQKYYHVVGVWNKDEGKAYIYVDGKLMNTVNAAGTFKFPNAKANWFAIGCDAGPTAQLGWIGDVVLARVYDKPLDANEVSVLWNEIDKLQQHPQQDLVTDVSFNSSLPVKVGKPYSIKGEGFQAGDKVQFTSLTDASKVITLDATVVEGGIEVTATAELGTDEYRMMLLRGDAMQDLGTTKMAVMDKFPAAPGVVAHRGYYRGVAGEAQNSVAALKAAQKLGVYGSECDVWLTTDGYLVMNHDQKINGVEIQDNPYSSVKDFYLSNGEKLPQLYQFLEALQDKSYNTKLFLEIKTHNSAAKNKACVAAVLKEIEKYGVKDRVQFIGFDLDNVCREIVRLDPEAEVGYLNGNLTPAQLNALGIKGIHYSQKLYRANPTWMQEANELGMTVNVQGCNTVSDMAEMINMGADLISSDYPAEAMKVRQYYLDNQ